MLVEAFAKINWSLDVVGVREDGYHLLDMLMQPVSLADDVFLTPGKELALSTSGYPPVRADAGNLAYRAAAALREATGCTMGAAIHVHKRIPVGAGLGGGSADAAAVLFGLNRLWETGLSAPRLEEIGLKLGADVPFCLRGGLTRTRGIGEEMDNLPCRYSYWLVLVQPCRGLSTREVFQDWTAEDRAAHPDTEQARAALAEGDLPRLCGSIRNMLQPVSERKLPEIGAAIRRLKEEGALTALMTGSGSAVFGVFRTGDGARRAAEKLHKRWRSVFLCHTQHDSLRLREE